MIEDTMFDNDCYAVFLEKEHEKGEAMDDTISRQAAIDALWKALYAYENKTEKQFIESDELDINDWIQHRIFVQNMSDIDRQTIQNLPTIEAVPLEDYRSMEQTVYKLTQALAEAEPTKHYNTESYKMTVTDFPPVEYAPIKRGRWINVKISLSGDSSAECSLCGAVVHNNFSNVINYCPNCGAKMDEVAE